MIATHELLSRRWKRKTKLGVGEEIEIGEPGAQPGKDLALANTNPVFLRHDTPGFFTFRVRNLFGFEPSMFSLEIDSNGREIILRTNNKKYFKRFDIGDLVRAGLKLDSTHLTYQFANNTLVIQYRKPDAIIAVEAQRRAQFEHLNQKNPQEGDLECTTQ